MDFEFTKDNWLLRGVCPYCEEELYSPRGDRDIDSGSQVMCELCCTNHDECGACFTVTYLKPTTSNPDYEPIDIFDNGSTW